MKKFLFWLLLLTVPVIAQTQGKYVGRGYSWSDSIYYGAGTATVDSVKIYNMGIKYDWYSLILKGNANTTVDSLIITRGAIGYTEQKAAVDTVWGDQFTWKDSSWTAVNTVINNTVGVDYTAFEPLVHLLKIEYLNHWGTDSDRKTRYILQALRRD